MGKYYKYKNLEENRFQEFDKSDILSGPLHIAIDITNKCNAKCLHCFNRSGNGLLRNEISDREMLEIFKEIAVIKPFSTCFCGGEPMMKYDLVLRATEVLKNGGVPNIAMVTNGWFLTKDRVISLRNAGLTHIQLSLDGKDAKTHERMRGINGIYEKVLDALNFIDDAGISSAVAFSPTQFNIKQFPEVVELLQKFENLREIKVQPLMPLGKAVEGKSELFASEEEYRELVAYIERFNAKRDYNNKGFRSFGGNSQATADLVAMVCKRIGYVRDIKEMRKRIDELDYNYYRIYRDYECETDQRLLSIIEKYSKTFTAESAMWEIFPTIEELSDFLEEICTIFEINKYTVIFKRSMFVSIKKFSNTINIIKNGEKKYEN